MTALEGGVTLTLMISNTALFVVRLRIECFIVLCEQWLEDMDEEFVIFSYLRAFNTSLQRHCPCR